MMVHEYDRLEIPEEYKKMSVEELEAEKERLYETLKGQNRGEVKNKIAKSPVIFRSLKKTSDLP